MTYQYFSFVSLLHKIYPSHPIKSLIPNSNKFISVLTKIYGGNICPYCKNNTLLASTEPNFQIKMRKSLECDRLRGEKNHTIIP